MNTEKLTDLYPCPFCGNQAKSLESHRPDCFFPLSEQLKSATGANAFDLAIRVADAWKRRVAPAGYKIIAEDMPKSAFEAWERSVPIPERSLSAHGRPTAPITASNMALLFPKLLEHMETYESHMPRPTDPA